LKPLFLSFLYGPPKQKLHSAALAKPCVGAAVLVHKRALVTQGQNTGDRLPLFGGDSNLGAVAKTSDQVAKPVQGVRRELLPPPCEQEQVVELLQQRFRSAGFVTQGFTLGAANLSLYAVPMEAAKELIPAWTQIYAVQPKPFGFPESWHALYAGTRWPYLDVL